jgi:hypothetical protein
MRGVFDGMGVGRFAILVARPDAFAFGVVFIIVSYSRSTDKINRSIEFGKSLHNALKLLV